MRDRFLLGIVTVMVGTLCFLVYACGPYPKYDPYVSKGRCDLSPECKERGACVHIIHLNKCVVESDLDCQRSNVCRDYGKCIAADGACQRGGSESNRAERSRYDGGWGSDDPDSHNSPKDCESTEDCTDLGLCKNVDGACVATTYSCQVSRVCKNNGRCSVKGNGCVADLESDCKKSTYCQEKGMCSLKGDQCVATLEQDCQQSQGCQKDGQCVLQDGECIAPSDDYCGKLDLCKEDGRCSSVDKKCAVKRDRDCEQSKGCQESGRCSAVKGKCVVLVDEDCQKSSACKVDGRCKAQNGVCQ